MRSVVISSCYTIDLLEHRPLNIVQFPHPTLRRINKPLRRVDRKIKTLVAEMFELMYAAKGIGLAANQVDLPFRLFIINPAGERGSGDEYVLINPVIDSPKGREVAEEGCLSLPGLYRQIARPDQIHVAAYDLSGNAIDMHVDGLLARVIQHEFDHLQGVLFVDRLDDGDVKSVEDDLRAFESEFLSYRAAGRIENDEAIEQRLKELETEYC